MSYSPSWLLHIALLSVKEVISQQMKSGNESMLLEIISLSMFSITLKRQAYYKGGMVFLKTEPQYQLSDNAFQRIQK